MSSDTTLITGASSGIGLHLAHEFARHGHSLILVAPVEAELQQVASAIRAEHGVDVLTIAKDLERPEAPQELFDDLAGAGVQVEILVNNAGHGQRGKFWEIPLEMDLSMIRLNIEAVVRMTKLFLPPMLARGSGRLLTTASVAGFEPGPQLAVYHATKAFVLSLTEALAVELEDTPISVTALCPGPTDTDFFPKADMENTMIAGQAMAPQDVAKAGYHGLMGEDLIVIPGGMNKMLVAGRRILTEKAQAKMNEKFYDEVPADKQKYERGEKELKAAMKQHD